MESFPPGTINSFLVDIPTQGIQSRIEHTPHRRVIPGNQK